MAEIRQQNEMETNIRATVAVGSMTEMHFHASQLVEVHQTGLLETDSLWEKIVGSGRGHLKHYQMTGHPRTDQCKCRVIPRIIMIIIGFATR